ncbi:MAG: type II toxin-antitoxin system mRNA interferase toxin, RelE/StbE family [Chitinispirillales bacterium]|jgi:addiction module RelE/StbE family toxin|nr:type II toxin-antitoxin system mRNA interferase toxin, RelE/StbE family [Chitinispirillales bacterium]
MNKRNIAFSRRFTRKLKKINAEKLRLISVAITKFQKGKDETLRIHKLKGKYKDFWSFDAAYDLRVIYFLNEKGTVIIHNLYDFGTHEELYAD